MWILMSLSTKGGVGGWGGVSDQIPVHTSFRNAELIILNWFVMVRYLFIYFLMTTNSSFGSLTSSFMPVSSSIMTQASIGSAISLPLLFRCSSSPVPNAGFSVHESKNRGSRGSTGSQEKRGTVSATNLKRQNKCYLGLGGKKPVWSGIIRSAADLDGRFLGQHLSLRPDVPFSNWCQITIVFWPTSLPALWPYILHGTSMWTFNWNSDH